MPSTLNLITHCGASKVDREQVFAAATPEPTRTHYPLSHKRLIEQVESSLSNCGFKVINEAHALSHENNRYFGLFQVAKADDTRAEAASVTEGFSVANSTSDEYSLVVGLRNSNDRVFPAGLLLGSQLFVCDNLSFTSADGIKLSRKHSRYCDRDLTSIVSNGVAQLTSKRHDLETRYTAYKNHELSDAQAHDLVIRALDNRAITVCSVPDVLKEYRSPRHPEFAARNVFSLFNAFTEKAKSGSIFSLPARTGALHGVFDGYCGLALSN